MREKEIKIIQRIMTTFSSINMKREIIDRVIAFNEKSKKISEQEEIVRKKGGEIDEDLTEALKREKENAGSAMDVEEIKKLIDYEINYAKTILPLLSDSKCLSEDIKKEMKEALEKGTFFDVENAEKEIVQNLDSDERNTYQKYEYSIDSNDPEKEIVLSFARFSEALKVTIDALEKTIDALEKHLEAVEKHLEAVEEGFLQEEKKVEEKKVEEEETAIKESSLFSMSPGMG